MALIVTLLLIAALILFILACTRLARSWMIPAGLACWVATELIGRVL